MSIMQMRDLGSTGVKVSMVGVGGYHLGQAKSEAEAIRIVHTALESGVTFFDNCWDYNDGRSEEWMGKGLAGKRQQAFLMTKTDGRTRASCKEQLEQSLKRLRTDVIDLVQIHEVIRMNDAERVFGPDGAMEALVHAKQAGKLRFIGFTGHKDPAMHLHMLEVADRHGFHFDTVQMPLNVMDPHYKSFEKQVLPVLVEKKIGVLGMKPMGAGFLLESKLVSAPECLRYSMSLPTSVVITGCESLPILEQAISTALSWKPLSDEEKAKLLARTRPVAEDGRFERFKTTTMFDGTEQHPHWLEAARL